MVRARGFIVLISTAAVLLTGCGKPESEEERTGAAPPVDSLAPGNGGPGDPSADGSQETAVRTGVKRRSGELHIGTDTVSGTEDVYLQADSDADLDLCRIRYDFSEVARRSDCDDCMWAVDLLTSNARIVLGSGAACTALGATDDEPGALNGRTVSYGYNDDYFGHAEVVMFLTPEEGWQPLGFAEIDHETAIMIYRAVEGECEY